MSMGELVRETVAEYITGVRVAKMAAMDCLAQLDAPVGTWEEMKKEIVQGAVWGPIYLILWKRRLGDSISHEGIP